MDRGPDKRNFENDLRPVTAQHTGNRGIIPVKDIIDILLPSVLPHPLEDIPFRVHEADSYQRYSKIAALLEIIASKKSKPPGIERQGPVQPVFC